MHGLFDRAKQSSSFANTPKKIHDHPANSSPSKALFSFTRSRRFPHDLNLSPCKEAFYNTKDSFLMGSKAYSISKQKRSNVIDSARKDTPAPDSYTPYLNELSSQRKRGFSFGVSREKAPHFSINPDLKQKAALPGPGSYTPTLPKSLRTVGFRIRTHSNRSQNNENIGPGTYDVGSTFQPNRTIFNSKFQNLRGIVIPKLKTNTTGQSFFISGPKKTTGSKSPDHSKRMHSRSIDSSRKDHFYDTKHQINPNGTFFNSKYPNTKCRTFPRSKRKLELGRSDGPGPGAYIMPSDFGIYQSNTPLG